MIGINFGFRKMLKFTQWSAKSAQNHFQLQVKEEKPWTHMLKVWNINSVFQTTIQKTAFEAGQTENRPSSNSKQTSFSLLRKMKQQKKLRYCGPLKLSLQSIHFALVTTNLNFLVQFFLTAWSQKHLLLIKQNVNTLYAMA